MKPRFVLLLASLAALATSACVAEELPHYLREAEHATLAGKSWIMNDAASGGSSVSLQGNPVTWKAVTQAGTYRLFPWKVWHYQLHGCWIWTYLGGNAWNGRRWDGGVVYPGHGEIITSRRWELFRDGLEDYLYLHLLRKRLDAQAKIGTNVDATRKLIDDAVTAVLGTSNDPALAQTWRKRMAEMIME
jgi:hypothetical protein